MWEEFINYKIKKGSGLVIGDVLQNNIDNDKLVLKMKVIGFDDSGVPFVEYTKVKYAKGIKPEKGDHDAYVVGDILPFPWDNPLQYKKSK